MNEFLFAVNTRWSIDDAFNIYIYAALPTATGLQGGDGGQLPGLGLTLIWMFHHLAHQHSQFCQIPICPSRAGQNSSQPNPCK